MDLVCEILLRIEAPPVVSFSHEVDPRYVAAMTRKAVPQEVQESILVLCRRRCALCFGLNQDLTVNMNGQIAHINRNANDSRPENLAYLCFDHHNLYDSKPSQSKGLTEGELREYQRRLYEQFEDKSSKAAPVHADTFAEFEDLVPPKWRYIYVEALEFYTSQHRLQEAVLMALETPQSLEQIAAGLIPPDNLQWTVAIIEDALKRGLLRKSVRQPGKYEATTRTKVFLEVLDQVPEAVKQSAGMKIWRPDWLELPTRD